MPGANHTEIFACSPEQLYDVIADYEKYPEFLSEVKNCQILKTEGDKKLVEYKVSLIKSFKYTLAMTEQRPEMISWEFVGGDVFKSSSGHWKLQEEAGRTRAIYKVEAQFSMFIPGPIAKTLLTVNLPTMMSAYHKRIKELYG
jgi:coenzyme Q-binding protein COQ10